MANGACMDCATSCRTCNGPSSDDCTSCMGQEYELMYKYGNSGSCECTEGFYKEFRGDCFDFAEESYVCNECDSKCRSCYGSEKNNCIECKDNMTKDEHGIC